jgi:PIN domain nuclease of toxin-antitoxin system
LLDTDVVINSMLRSRRVPQRVRDALSDPTAVRLISVVSVFEISVKHSLGKLPLPESFDRSFSTAFNDVLDGLAATTLDVRLSHALRVRGLPPHHRDPFDRLLIAQALEEGLTMVSSDRQFAAYDGLKLMPA